MKLIVDKDIKEINIIVDDAASTAEMDLHIEQSADIIIINIEEIVEEN